MLPKIPTQKSEYVHGLYITGHSEKAIAGITGYSLETVQRYAAPAKRAFALELFNFGFTEREITAQTGYKPETVRRILRSSPDKDTLKVGDSDRLVQGIKVFVDYHSEKEGRASRSQYRHRAMEAFEKVKLPQIIAQATNSLNLGALAEPPKDPYELLLFEVRSGGFPNAAHLGRFSFNEYIRSRPEEVSVDGLVQYLRQGIVSSFREILKFPVYVDREGIDAAIGSLKPREQEVIRKRFFEGRTPSQIKDDYQLSAERIRQIESKAKRNLWSKEPIRLADPDRLRDHVRKLEGIVEENARKIKEKDATIGVYETIYGLLPGTPINPELKMKLDTPIDELELSVRASIALHDVKTVGKLVQKTEEELLRTKQFGRKSIDEIKVILAEMGLQLGMRLPEELAMQYT